MRRARPDFLPIDDKVAVGDVRLGSRGGQVAPRSGFRITLAPDDLAANGALDPPGALLPGPDFEQRRHQHADALIHDTRIDAPLGDLLGDDSEFQDVERQAKTAVLLWDIAREVAVLEQQLLPIEGLLAWPLSSATGFGRQVAVRGDEGAHLALQRPIVLRIGQLHGASSIAGRSRDPLARR